MSYPAEPISCKVWSTSIGGDDSILRDLNGAMISKNVIEIYFQKGTSSIAEPPPSPMSSLVLFLEPPPNLR